MSIGMTIYTNLEAPELQKGLEQFREENNYLFNKYYLLYDAKEIFSYKAMESWTDKRAIYDNESSLLHAKDYGMEEPKSFFIVGVNDKTFSAISTEEIADLLREKLGKDNILVLLNGEVPI